MRAELIFGYDKDSAGAYIPREQYTQAINLIANRAVITYGGCTLIDATGAWRPKKRPVQHERSKVLIIDSTKIVTDKMAIRLLAEYICRVLNQAEVIITFFPADTEIVKL